MENEEPKWPDNIVQLRTPKPPPLSPVDDVVFVSLDFQPETCEYTVRWEKDDG
jgi:hypothetical protein